MAVRPKPRPVIRVFQALVAVALVVIIGYSWFEFNSHPPGAPPIFGVQYIDSVAVMPLENLTGDESYEHLGIGITEEIITHLAQIAPLKVISRHSVQALADQDLTVTQLAQRLGVRHIIEGSIRMDGDHIRITLQHVNAETDTHLWEQNFRGELGDVFGMQEDVSRQTTTRIISAIPGISQPNLDSHVEHGPGHEAYLLGKQWLGERTPDGLRNAIEQFSEALRLDPLYTPAFADLASAYALALSYRYDVGLDGYALAARSLAMSERAIQLDPNMAGAYAARGYLGVLIGQAAEAVAADFDRAAQLQPNAASIPSWRARSLAQLGQPEEAVSEAVRAVELDPLAPGRHIAVAELSLHLGRYEVAIKEARIATAIEPALMRARAAEARALLLSGRAGECARLPLGPHRVLLATCLSASGRQPEADEIIEDVLERIGSGQSTLEDYTAVIAYEDLAVDYAWRGDAEKSLFWAARAYGLSPVGLEIRVLESALFDSVRTDPEFARSLSAIRDGLYDRVRRDSRQLL